MAVRKTEPEDTPDWRDIISWSPPTSVASLNSNRSLIPPDPGFYAFTPNRSALRVGNVLYIGETENLRNRLPNYLHLRPRETHTRHKGALFILDHRLTKSDDDRIFVRWSPFESDYGLRRDIEAAMIQYYGSWYNHRDWNRDHPF